MERVKKFFASETPVRWLFNGDSITHGAKHTHGYRDYSELFAERVRHELGRTGDLVIKSAISGNTTRDLLNTFEHRVEAVKPHVVFYMIGMNDCNPAKEVSLTEYGMNLDLLGQKTEKIGAIPVFQTCNPLIAATASAQQVRATLPDYIQTLRNVAASRNWPLIDHWEFWMRQDVGLIYSWMNDNIHPNAYGHLAFYRYLIETLGVDTPAGAQQRLYVPGL